MAQHAPQLVKLIRSMVLSTNHMKIRNSYAICGMEWKTMEWKTMIVIEEWQLRLQDLIMGQRKLFKVDHLIAGRYLKVVNNLSR